MRIVVALWLFQMEHDRPTPDEAKWAEAITSRYIRNGKVIIENVGSGYFPYLEGQVVAGKIHS